ncbi:MAG: hypothetical protein R6U84_03510 [Candidatus Cloacimonadales bacterium]
MKNSKGLVLLILVIAVAFTSLNVIAIAAASGNAISQTECTAQGDFTPAAFSNQLAQETVETDLYAIQGDIKPAPWSDFYPVDKKDTDDSED